VKIRLALVKRKAGGKVDLVVEEMDAKQVRLFSLLDLGKSMDNNKSVACGLMF